MTDLEAQTLCALAGHPLTEQHEDKSEDFTSTVAECVCQHSHLAINFRWTGLQDR